MNKYLTVSRINFKYTTWIAYMVAIICAVSQVVDIIIDKSIGETDDTTISLYTMLYIVAILAPIFIASTNYNKLMNIGVKKKTYFFGCIINYVVIAFVLSLLGVLEHYLLDPALSSAGTNIYGLIEVFGWDSNVFTAFFSQFAFILFAETVFHTLTFMQTRWYGWAADALVIIIISVFTPIPVLRSAELFFFEMTIFATPVVQIFVCLGLAALIYATNLFYLKKRNV